MGWLFVSTICATLQLASQEYLPSQVSDILHPRVMPRRGLEAPFQKEASVYAEHQCQEAP